MSATSPMPLDTRLPADRLAFTGGPFLSGLISRQPELASVAIAFLLAMVPTLLAMQFDARTVNDISVWVKPTKFLLSLGVFYATLAWCFGYLPRAAQQTPGGRFVIWGSISVGVLEMLWLVAAAVQGVPSHFNANSVVWQVAYFSAGMGATLLLVAMTVQARMIARDALPSVSPVLRAGLVQGAYIALVTTLVTAFFLAAGTGHWVGGTASDAAGMPLLGWSRDGGDLRVAHFWALHAQQLVPLLAYVLGDRLGLLRTPNAVRLLGVVYVAFIVFTFVQALQGQPFIG